MVFYEKAGGDAKLYRQGVYSGGALQGYRIDKKTADHYGIKSIDQLKDPAIAKLFDTDGDGKADLAGCNPGWGCEKVIQHHLATYGLRDPVTHKQGSYAPIIADTHHPPAAGAGRALLHLDTVLGEWRAGSGQGRDLAAGAVLGPAGRTQGCRHRPPGRLQLWFPGQQAASEAGAFITLGCIVAFPTETVYGLGANVFDATAVAKIFEAKRRPADNPLIAHVATREQMGSLADEITECANKFIDAFFPGPLTVVLRKRKAVPRIATAGLDTIGIRMPMFGLANEFLRACGVPVGAPSANISGRPSPTTWQAVLEDLDGRIDCLLKGPNLPRSGSNRR